jgi:hypothetical protein
MPILIRFLCVLSILGFAVVPDLSLQGQHRALPKKCVMPTNDPLTPEYIVSQVRYTPDRPAQKYLLISVRPDQFTKEQMIALATRLRLEFCEETKFGAMLFDDDYAAKHVTFLSLVRRTLRRHNAGDTTLIVRRSVNISCSPRRVEIAWMK